MAALFRKSEGTTVVVLDIENGSVAAALAHFAPGQPPTLFAQTRIETPLTRSVQSVALVEHIERAVRDALAQVSLVAGRLRNAQHAPLVSMGDIAHAAVFLAAPWGAPNLDAQKPDFIPGMRHFLRQELSGFTDAPLSFYTAAAPAAYGAMHLYPQETSLLLLLQGELLELVLAGPQRVEGYATVPLGYRSLVRTLQTHAGLSAPEAMSALRLPQPNDAFEPLQAAAHHMLSNSYDALRQLTALTAPSQVLVLSHTPASAWFARALAQDDSIADLFPHGGEVRALDSQQLRPHVNAHASKPDLPLMLDALYLHQNFI